MRRSAVGGVARLRGGGDLRSRARLRARRRATPPERLRRFCAIDLIATSGVGTSAGNTPPAPVGSRPIASKTSMPSVTRREHRVAGSRPPSSCELSPRFTKNCDCAESGSSVRAAATVPRVVAQPVARLVGDRRQRPAQAQLAVEAAALHDALRQHAVKHRSRVEAHVDVAQEIRDVLRRLRRPRARSRRGRDPCRRRPRSPVVRLPKAKP